MTAVLRNPDFKDGDVVLDMDFPGSFVKVLEIDGFNQYAKVLLLDSMLNPLPNKWTNYTWKPCEHLKPMSYMLTSLR